MATQSSTNGTPIKTGKSAEDLQREVETLKADISRLSDTLLELGKQRTDETMEDLHARAQILKLRGEEAAHRAQDEIGRLTADAERTVRERPLTALAVAAGLGLLFGLMQGRK